MSENKNCPKAHKGGQTGYEVNVVWVNTWVATLQYEVNVW